MRESKGCQCQIGSVVKAVIVLALMLGLTSAVVFWVYTTRFTEVQEPLVDTDTTTPVHEWAVTTPPASNEDTTSEQPMDPVTLTTTEQDPTETTTEEGGTTTAAAEQESTSPTEPSTTIQPNSREGKAYLQMNITVETDFPAPPADDVVKTIKDSDPDMYMDAEGNLHLLADRGSNGHGEEAASGSSTTEEAPATTEEHQVVTILATSVSDAHGDPVDGSVMAGSSVVDLTDRPEEVIEVDTEGEELEEAELNALLERVVEEKQRTRPEQAAGHGSAASQSIIAEVSTASEVVVVYGTGQRAPAVAVAPTTALSSSSSASSARPGIQTYRIGAGQDAFDDTSGSIQASSTEQPWTQGGATAAPENNHYVTKTVTGFLDFVTTVGNTVMVFTPQAGKASASTQIVTPVFPAKEEAVDRPNLGLEGLFEKFERPEFPEKKLESTLIEEAAIASTDKTPVEQIRPSSVIKTAPLTHPDAVTTLSNGLIEVDGAYDDPKFDKASREPEAHIDDEGFRVISTIGYSTAPVESTVTQVHSKTLYSNFFQNGGRNPEQVGIITATGGTLIANGVTTVHSTKVLGTYLDNGEYAQVIASTSKVFQEGSIQATPVVRLGEVQHVTERPSFGIAVAGQQGSSSDPLPLESLFDEDDQPLSKFPRNTEAGVGSVQVIDAAAPSTGSRLFGNRRKPGAALDFKERLKNRYQSFRKSLEEDAEIKKRENVGHGTVTTLGNRPASNRFTPSSRGSSFRTRKERGRFYGEDKSEEVQPEEEVEIVKPSKSVRTYGHSSRNRGSYRDSSRIRSRLRNDPEPVEQPEPEADLDVGASTLSDTTGFGTRRRGGISRFRNRLNTSRRKPTTTTTSAPSFRLKSPENSFRPKTPSAPKPAELPKPKFAFKKFNRFNRPDIRQSLLQKILNKGRPKNTLSLEEQAEAKDEEEESIAPSAPEQLQQPGPEDAEEAAGPQLLPRTDGLTTTLVVSTVYPEELSSSMFLEVATIRSPYSFDFDDGMSTRFITVTRTFTSSVAPSTTTTTSAAEVIEPSSTASSPLFQTETIPAPENILTSSLPPVFHSSELVSSIETLPAVVLQSKSGVTPPLKTVTETFSTKELMLKTSILPIVVNGKTRHHTLTQSYYVTRLVEAVKTIPPMEAYEFIPTKAFTDFSNVLDEAGSEKREQLLPGELEFSDQDEHEGPQEVRVAPPPGFRDDLKLIGSKFDPADQMEKKHNPEIVELKSTNDQLLQLQQQQQQQFAPSLQGSFNPFALAGLLGQLGGQQAQPKPQVTPSLPGGFNFTPEQIQQLALLQYLQNPFGGLAGLPNLQQAALPAVQPQGQQIVASKPILKEKTLYTTATIPLFLGNKKFFTTLTSAIGVTTVTEYEQQKGQAATAAPSLPSLPSQGNLPVQNPLANLQPSFTVTSEPVVKETTVPSTVLKEIKITFRNTPTLTTLTSTTMVRSQITSYVTKTVRAQATAPPQAQGLGLNPFAAFLG